MKRVSCLLFLLLSLSLTGFADDVEVIGRTNWQIAATYPHDSGTSTAGDGGAAWIIDDNTDGTPNYNTWYHTDWSTNHGAVQGFMIDMAEVETVSMVHFEGRTTNGYKGLPTSYRLYAFETAPFALSDISVDNISTTNTALGTPISSGSLSWTSSASRQSKDISFKATKARYVLFVWDAVTYNYPACSDFQIYRYQAPEGETVSYTLNLSHADLGNLLPQPRSVNLTGNSCTLSGDIAVYVSGTKTDMPGAVGRFITEMGLAEGSDIALNINYVGKITGTEDYTVAGFDNEAYALKIDGSTITVSAIDTIGIVRAMQTLTQLAGESHTLPGCEIVDWPAFKVRGIMHDIGRSYISVAELKREIDLLSRFKENVFLWHLTDKHGFRFESKKYPQVNTNFTPTRSQEYYTQAECAEVMNYARERGVMVIPEIDMPGHSARFEGAMGYTMASDQGKATLKDILTEVADVFSFCPYIHIGGDETNDATLDYINEMADYIHDNLDRRVVVWNKYGGNSNRASVDPTTLHVDMSTNWATSGVLSSGIPNIDMRYNYINHFDMFGDLAGIYRSSIFGVQKGNADVAGSITGLWNDRLISDEELIIRENNLYANALATADRGWKGGGLHYLDEAQGGAYLPNSGSEYEEFQNWESRFLFHKGTTLKAVESQIPFVHETHMRWNLSKSYSNGGDGSAKFDIEDKDELTPQPGDITVTGAGVWLNHIWAGTVAGVLGRSAQSTGQTRYAWTYVYSDSEQTVGANIETYDYSRSQMGAAPDNGKWDRMGSRVWINGSEIVPTEDWTTGGSGEETELGNVNFTTRKPIPVTLHEGWNKVVLKLPYVNNTVGYYKSKWQFTFFFTDLDGINAVDGLVYNQNKSFTDEFEETVPTPPFVVDRKKVYTLKSKRGSRYVTSSAQEGTISGKTSLATDGTAYWVFLPREDGNYNITNYLYLGMINGDGVSSGSAMSTSCTVPSTGWGVQPSALDGWSIIVGGSHQFNQQNNGSYDVLNWGGGTNTTDEGCQYQIEEVDGLLVGDVNKDSKVTITDIPNLSAIIMKNADNPKESDVNFDGKTDLLDIKSLKALLLDE